MLNYVYNMKRWTILFLILISLDASAAPLTLRQAEDRALQSSSLLKAYAADRQAAAEQSGAQFSALVPRISLQGNYTYIGTIPELAVGPGAPIKMGSNSNYSIGPVLNYVLWDGFSAINTYQATAKLAKSREAEEANARLQVLLAVRLAYVQVQLSLEELRLVGGSLDLTKAQRKDVQNRVNVGAATQLDQLVSNRQVLFYELQSKQKQAEVAANLKTLFALTGDTVPDSLTLDSLHDTVTEEAQADLTPPDDGQPQIRGVALSAESARLAADSLQSKLMPTLYLSASSTLAYPNGPVLQQINQNTASVILSMPLVLGDPTSHLVAEKRQQAEAAHYREEQLRTNLQRDFSKSSELLKSLIEQKALSQKDVEQSESVARLYYTSYKAGKINLIDVQTADTQALQAKVGAARIDAQILVQLFTLKALSGKEV